MDHVFILLLKSSSSSPETLHRWLGRSSLGHQNLAMGSFGKKSGLSHLGCTGPGDDRVDRVTAEGTPGRVTSCPPCPRPRKNREESIPRRLGQQCQGHTWPHPLLSQFWTLSESPQCSAEAVCRTYRIQRVCVYMTLLHTIISVVECESQEIFTHDALTPVDARHVITSEGFPSLCHVAITKVPYCPTPRTVWHACHISA